MSIKGKAYVMGAFEHPTREAKDKSTPQLHVECARGALEDAGLTKDDIDGYSAPATHRGSAPCRWPTTWACAICVTWTLPRPAAAPTSCMSGTQRKRSRPASAQLL